MSKNNLDQPKKSSSFFLEKLGQKISTIKVDIADEFERRKQLYNQASSNQVHFTRTSTNESEDSLIIEKKPPSPTSSGTGFFFLLSIEIMNSFVYIF
jgi:hypothetical protein